METTSASTPHLKPHKRPDSLQLELLPIPEDGPLVRCGQGSTGSVHVGFKSITYSVKEGLFRKSKFICESRLVLARHCSIGVEKWKAGSINLENICMNDSRPSSDLGSEVKAAINAVGALIFAIVLTFLTNNRHIFFLDWSVRADVVALNCSSKTNSL
jgi:hypothetical protein